MGGQKEGEQLQPEVVLHVGRPLAPPALLLESRQGQNGDLPPCLGFRKRSAMHWFILEMTVWFWKQDLILVSLGKTDSLYCGQFLLLNGISVFSFLNEKHN